jgi:uroporphyrinogen-III synthase
VELSTASAEALAALGRHRLAVFVSANAVRYGLPLIHARGGWPPGLAAAAVGSATAELLRSAGVGPVWAPQAGGDSAALLAHAELQDVAGWSIVVFRGVGGRELLGETLQARGARIHYVECYRRCVPQIDPAPVRAALGASGLDAVVAASGEGLRNLLDMLGVQWSDRLRRLPLVVTHPQVASAARSLGFEQVLLAGDAHTGIIDCLAGLQRRDA